ncbi:hypothetical protein [Sulfurimonas sp.]
MKVNSLIEALWMDSSKIKNAVNTYLGRKKRDEHPNGTFDNAGRWYPDESENLDTDYYRSPSRSYPYSYMLACRTLRHAVEDLELMYAPSALKAAKRLARALEKNIEIECSKNVIEFKTIIGNDFEYNSVEDLIVLKDRLEDILDDETKATKIKFLEKEINILEQDLEYL